MTGGGRRVNAPSGTETHLWEGVCGGQQHVLGLQVAVSDVFEVQIPQGLQYLVRKHVWMLQIYGSNRCHGVYHGKNHFKGLKLRPVRPGSA